MTRRARRAQRRLSSSNPGTALFILLPGASIDTKGGGTINITGNPSVTASQVPVAFQQYTEPSCRTTSPPSCLFNEHGNL